MALHVQHNVDPRRCTSVLVLRPDTPTAHANLRRWLENQADISHIAVLGQAGSARLREVVSPQPLHVAPWRSFTTLVNRFATVVVLCVVDDDVDTGATAYRILGELLFGDRVVLIGPQASRTWPGGRSLFKSRRLRELAMLAGVGVVALCSTSIALVAVLLQDAWLRLKAPR